MLTVCGLLAASSVKLSVPVSAPLAVGVKVTPTVHVLPAATVLQVLEAMAKSPVMPTDVMFSVTVLLLVTVTVWDELVAPTG